MILHADGGYVPRIMFGGSDGIVNPEVFNEGGNAKYKYYYPAIASIEASMQSALKSFAKKSDL